jgi:translation initiation factor IF-3
VIDSAGEQAGVMDRSAAIALAKESELDLVEVSPNAEPPVCRIMDFGKHLFEQKKKSHAGKVKQRHTHLKEVKFRPGTEVGDYQVKMKNLIKFLTAGDKTKVTLRFRGREMAHQELGMQLLERVRADLEEYGTVEQFPKMEGRQLIMVLAPKKN